MIGLFKNSTNLIGRDKAKSRPHELQHDWTFKSDDGGSAIAGETSQKERGSLTEYEGLCKVKTRHDPVNRKDDKSGLENLIRCIRDRDSETLCIKIPRNAG